MDVNGNSDNCADKIQKIHKNKIIIDTRPLEMGKYTSLILTVTNDNTFLSKHAAFQWQKHSRHQSSVWIKQVHIYVKPDNLTFRLSGGLCFVKFFLFICLRFCIDNLSGITGEVRALKQNQHLKTIPYWLRKSRSKLSRYFASWLKLRPSRVNTYWENFQQRKKWLKRL